VSFQITRVGEADLADLLPLMRGYSDFYEVDPADEDLLALSRALIADPDREGLQLIARDSDSGQALGFATVYWLWSTSRAARIGLMNDLFTAQAARRRGVGEALIEACLDAVEKRGAVLLQWQTARDNHTAQALYERVGGIREEWYDYYLESRNRGD
jgi:GNAT superfamily N-acetyltransferase